MICHTMSQKNENKPKIYVPNYFYLTQTTYYLKSLLKIFNNGALLYSLRGRKEGKYTNQFVQRKQKRKEFRHKTGNKQIQRET